MPASEYMLSCISLFSLSSICRITDGLWNINSAFYLYQTPGRATVTRTIGTSPSSGRCVPYCMKTLNEIYSTFKLDNSEVNRLSNESKSVSIGCGMKGVIKDLKPETWDLFYDISDKVWNSDLSNPNKINLGFQLFEIFPNYFHFLVPFYHGIRNKEITNQNDKEVIWNHFMNYLASESYYADPVGYVLWVDFFEDEATVRESWQGLMNNYSERKSLLRLLEHAGPVPFDLKSLVYESLLSDRETHQFIFNSLLYSAYEVFGKIDKSKTRKILAKLKVDTETENYKLLMEKLQ